jgi:hypothetical protein
MRVHWRFDLVFVLWWQMKSLFRGKKEIDKGQRDFTRKGD